MKNSIKALVLSGLCIALLSGVTHAQNVTIINSLARGTTDIAAPFVQGVDGKLYGTAPFTAGAWRGAGMIFKMAPATGNMGKVYSFCSTAGCPDGQYPFGTLFPMANGNFFGTTMMGGAYQDGSIFHVNRKGALAPVHSFCAQADCPDGKYPLGGVVLGNDGNFYGTTYQGGNSRNGGTIFQLAPSGQLTTLYDFCAQDFNCLDGAEPKAGLLLATDGNLYGTTYYGANAQIAFGGAGTIFRIAPDGTFTQVYAFCPGLTCTDGVGPATALIEGTDGNLYGTTSGGNVSNGTVFQITLDGALTVLYGFCQTGGCPDGKTPNGLMQATDGNFYGTTSAGGLYGAGTIFELTPAGQFTSLYSFCADPAPPFGNCPDGNAPLAGLFQASDGYLYGTTTKGGASTYGTTFKVGIN